MQRLSASQEQPKPRVFVSWAHAHRGQDPEGWARLVFDFATVLSLLGVTVELDLTHLHDEDVDWSTYGPNEIGKADRVLIVASSAYKERWEGTGDPRIGAGAAREANVLKADFEKNRDDFRRKAKVVLLPGVSLDDVPSELVSSTQRFHIGSLDRSGVEDLLRTLGKRPKWVLPQPGDFPDLEPQPVRDSPDSASGYTASTDGAAGSTPAPELEARHRQITADLVDADDEEARERLILERATVTGELQAKARLSEQAEDRVRFKWPRRIVASIVISAALIFALVEGTKKTPTSHRATLNFSPSKDSPTTSSSTQLNISELKLRRAIGDKLGVSDSCVVSRPLPPHALGRLRCTTDDRPLLATAFDSSSNADERVRWLGKRGAYFGSSAEGCFEDGAAVNSTSRSFTDTWWESGGEGGQLYLRKLAGRASLIWSDRQEAWTFQVSTTYDMESPDVLCSIFEAAEA